MKEFDDKIPIMVQTHRGNISIDDVIPGDVVYDFFTSEELVVMSLANHGIEDTYRIRYSDGREDFYQSRELIYNGIEAITVEDFLRKLKLFYMDNPLSEWDKKIDVNPITYNQNVVVNPVFPDPYIAGALLIHGNFDHEWANLPLDRSAANPAMAHKYHLNFANLTRPNTVFFRFNGSPPESIITWKEFFPKYPTLFSNELFFIPDEYMRASINDRWQFIRGAFDVGYNRHFFPESCSAAAIYEIRLQELQKMLWSLGIISTVRYDPGLPVARGRRYRIDVHEPRVHYPRFFYHVDIMSRHMVQDRRIQVNHPLLNLHIKGIKRFNRSASSSLVLDRPRRAWLSGNFLPRISL